MYAIMHMLLVTTIEEMKFHLYTLISKIENILLDTLLLILFADHTQEMKEDGNQKRFILQLVMNV